jgi:hypothetical protein
VAGTFNLIGLWNAAGSHSIGLASYSPVDADNYLLYMYDGQEVAVDTGVAIVEADYHTVVVTCDATTIKMFLDGTEVASTEDMTGLTDQAMFAGLGGANGDAGSVTCARFAVGYLAP